MQIQNSESSSARPVLLAGMVVLALVLTTVYFREGDNGPLRATRRALMVVSAPFEKAGEFVTRPARSVGSWASDFGVSRSELALLRRQNAELRARNAELEEARQENERVRSLVKFVETQDLEVVGARVIGRPTNSWEGIIAIDKGTDDGVESGMPAIGVGGLLGQVVEASESGARVRLITDQQSGVAAFVQRTRAEGIVRGSIDRELTFDFASQEASVRAGDVVITSGTGGVYPKGILVGEVTKVAKQQNVLSPVIFVRPVVRLGEIEEVLILTGRTPQPETGGGE